MGTARSKQAAAAGTQQLRRLQRGFPPQCAEQNHDHLICKIPAKHRLTGRSRPKNNTSLIFSVKILSISQSSQSCPDLKTSQIPLSFSNKMFVHLSGARLVRDLGTTTCQLIVKKIKHRKGN